MSDHTLARAMRPLHPAHAMLLAFPLPMFAGALLSDIAYARSFHIQWANFASWLIVGGVVMASLVTLWAVIDLLRYRARGQALYVLLLLAMWVAGVVNALVHARDAWGMMPLGLYLSVVTVLLAVVATWLGYSRNRQGDAL